MNDICMQKGTPNEQDVLKVYHNTGNNRKRREEINDLFFSAAYVHKGEDGPFHLKQNKILSL